MGSYRLHADTVPIHRHRFGRFCTAPRSSRLLNNMVSRLGLDKHRERCCDDALPSHRPTRPLRHHFPRAKRFPALLASKRQRVCNSEVSLKLSHVCLQV